MLNSVKFIYPKWQRQKLGNYLLLPQGVFTLPYNFFDTPKPSSTGGVKSSYTYPDRVYAILSYKRLLQ